MLESSHMNTCILEYVLADSKVLPILNSRNVRKPANQPHNKAPLLLVQQQNQTGHGGQVNMGSQ